MSKANIWTVRKPTSINSKTASKLLTIVILFGMFISGCSSPSVDQQINETLSINTAKTEILKNESELLSFVLDSKSQYTIDDIKCKSTNNSTVSVINNKVFGLSVGQATISCSMGSVVSNDLKITVNDANVPIDTQNPPDNGNESIVGKLMQVSYIDVGQGDSILIQTPGGKNILIDAGESSEKTVVSNYLKALKISNIDVLIATHPHADHIGGMAYIIDNFDIAKIYMPKASTTTATYENLLTTIKSKNLTITSAKAGMTISLDSSVTIKIIAPVGSGYSDLNQYSVVLQIIYNKTTFLFMGDAGSISEQEIINSGASLHADVLKVGHHGSSTATSEAFLKAVSPRFAVISVGTNNSYNHPAQTTLDKLVSAGVKVYRTDLNGTVIITSDGITVKVK